MYPEIFGLNSYGLFLSISALILILGSSLQAKRFGLSFQKTLIIFSLLVITTYLGARLFHYLTHLSLYENNLGRLFSISLTDLSLSGGLILSLLSGVILTRLFSINLWKLSDAVAPFLGVGIAIIRIGCFLNGCCFGKETNLPWGIKFPDMSESHLRQITSDPFSIGLNSPVHPTQIYELIAAIIGTGISIYCLKKKYPAGVAILAFGAWFAAFRWINYYLFSLPSTFDAPICFYPLVYSSVIVLCLFLLSRRLKLK